MKMKKRYKLILSILVILMIIITSIFNTTLKSIKKPIKEVGNRNRFENVLLVTQMNINKRNLYSTFGKNGLKNIYSNAFVSENFTTSNIDFKKILDFYEDSSYQKIFSSGDNTYMIDIETVNKNSYFKILCYNKKDDSKLEKTIKIKDIDKNKIVSLSNILEKDNKLYLIVTSDAEEISIVNLDFKDAKYDILDTLEEGEDLYPDLYTSNWNENDKYIYITLIDSKSSADEKLYLARFDFKTKKFLKEVKLEGISIKDGYMQDINIFLTRTKDGKYEAFVGNKDGYMYKFTYDENTFKLEGKEKLNLKINLAQVSYCLLKNNKIYYREGNIREERYIENNKENDADQDKQKFVIFDIDKNKVVYSAIFKSTNDLIFVTE
ncbi:hypothetical protein [Peptacetobacter sp.]|uniref:hypothetical protein n=1 Tax=Peptacetobacter sp. TaxID=2991975 RepID=UPI0026280D54|nr:hypothetical protein [Peptacetobacter sp.]